MSADTQTIRSILREPRDVAHRLGLRGVQRSGGRGVLAMCPSHSDRATPSLSLSVGDDNTLRVRCHSSVCELRGDVFDLVAAVEGIDRRGNFRRVFERACEIAALPASDLPDHTPPRRDPKLSVDDFDVFARELLAAGQLDRPGAADVRHYLESRHVLEEAIVDGWAALPPIGDVDLETAKRSWLALPSGDAWVKPTHRLCIPYRDLDGRVVTLERRALRELGGGERYVVAAGRPAHLPFGADRLAAHPAASVAFCEGAIDALALRALARRKGRTLVALGLPGASSWRPSWADLVTGRRVFIATDADAAGDAVAEEIGVHVEGVRVRPSGAKDWATTLERRDVERKAG